MKCLWHTLIKLPQTCRTKVFNYVFPVLSKEVGSRGQSQPLFFNPSSVGVPLLKQVLQLNTVNSARQIAGW